MKTYVLAAAALLLAASPSFAAAASTDNASNLDLETIDAETLVGCSEKPYIDELYCRAWKAYCALVCSDVQLQAGAFDPATVDALLRHMEETAELTGCSDKPWISELYCRVKEAYCALVCSDVQLQAGGFDPAAIDALLLAEDFSPEALASCSDQPYYSEIQCRVWKAYCALVCSDVQLQAGAFDPATIDALLRGDGLDAATLAGCSEKHFVWEIYCRFWKAVDALIGDSKIYLQGSPIAAEGFDANTLLHHCSDYHYAKEIVCRAGEAYCALVCDNQIEVLA